MIINWKLRKLTGEPERPSGPGKPYNRCNKFVSNKLFITQMVQNIVCNRGANEKYFWHTKKIISCM